MKPSEIIENIAVVDLSQEGRGVARLSNNKTVFIDFALPNEVVDIRVHRNKTHFCEAKVVNFKQPNADLRTEPFCKHFSVCGGCSLQHMLGTAQLALKQAQLINRFQALARSHPNLDVAGVEILKPLESQAFGYRRRARLSVKFVIKKNKLVIGFHERNHPGVADLDACPILSPTCQIIWDELASILEKCSVKDSLPQLEIAVGEDGLLALVLRHLKPLPACERAVLLEFAKTHRINFYLQSGGPDTLETLAEWGPLFYTIGDLRYEFSALDFVQINREVNVKMVEQAVDLLDVRPEDTILDLFCGMGNFSLAIARKQPARVVGVEGDLKLIQKATDNAHRNNIPVQGSQGLEFHQADLFKISDQAPWSLISFNKMLIDPPRAGAAAGIEWLAKQQPNLKQIVYVSCHPATLLRDAIELSNQGFKLTKLGVLDMFPQTSHVESMAVFVRG